MSQSASAPARAEEDAPPIVEDSAREDGSAGPAETSSFPHAPPEEDSTQEAEGNVPSSSESESEYADMLSRFADILALTSVTASGATPLPGPPALSSFDLKGVAELIASGQARRIVCMCGAGISVSAGIPDFRTPGTGLYSQLQRYNLPHPTAVFEIDFFRRNPRPFYLLAKELYPDNFSPTPTHHFIRLLHDKGLLLRCYTQNIDSLEAQAGLPADAIVAAHGNFDSAACIECKAPHDTEYVRRGVFEQEPCRCEKTPACSGLVKPGIVFFGEGLPERFWECVPRDFEQADMLIVLGTSLVVKPFATLIDEVGPATPRVLINRERVGEAHPEMRRLGIDQGFNFGAGNTRDVLFEGDCDAGVRELAALLGWREDLEALIAAGGGAGGEGEVGAGAEPGHHGDEDVGPAISTAAL